MDSETLALYWTLFCYTFQPFARLDTENQFSLYCSVSWLNKPCSRLKLSNFHTLSQTKLLKNHTFESDTFPSSLYLGMPLQAPSKVQMLSLNNLKKNPELTRI